MNIYISVIVPVYNMEKYISECLNSILNQTLKEIEVICIDDGSTDGTLEILEQYADNDSRVRLHRGDRLGPGLARNIGIKLATGEYVCMMDADDYYPDEFVLEELLCGAIKNDVYICGGNILNAYPDGSVKEDYNDFIKYGILDSQSFPRLFGQTRFIYERKFIVDNNIFYPASRMFEDPPFVFRAIMKAGRYCAIKKTVYIRRTEYKERERTREIAYDVLKCYIMCLKTAREYGLKSFYKEQIKPVLANLLYFWLPYAIQNDVRIDSLLKEIDEFAFEWIGEHSEFASNKDVMEFTDIVKKMIENCLKYSCIYVYGTGIVSKRIIDRKIIPVEKIKGFVRTICNNDQNFMEKPVFSIKSLCGVEDNYIVIVAANEKNAKEMENTINELAIKQYMVFTPKIIQVIDYLNQKSNGESI